MPEQVLVNSDATESMARHDAAAAAALAAGLFVVYALGACPTIYVGDSGELVTAVHLLGIPHPSGYPLYVMLGKLWTLLVPFGSVAFRMSLFSAACASLACAGLYLVCRRLRASPAASVFAALLLAFSPSFWAEANVQRTYSLNAFFLVVATAAALRWLERRDRLSLFVAFFSCGVGAANHLFMGVCGVCLGLVVVITEPGIVGRLRSLSIGAGAGLIGLLPYAYLPLRSRADPALDWGNPETVHGFLRVVFREDFWERRWLETPADLLEIAWDYAKSLGSETAWIGGILALLGFAALARRGRFVLFPVLVMLANVAMLAMHGSRTDIFIWHRYYIPSYVMIALAAGVGCDVIARRIPRRLGWVALAVPLAMLAAGWAANDRSRYRIAEEFSGTILRQLPPGAHLIATDDNILFTAMYLHFVEALRPDVDLILQGVGNADLPPLKFNPDTDPVFLTHHPNWNLPALEIAPVGLMFRAWRAGRPDPDLLLPGEYMEGELDRRVPKDYLTQNLIGQFHYMIGVTFEARDWLRARREFRLAAAASPDNDVLFYNLGLIYRRDGLLDDAIEAFRRSHAINPRHLASASRPRASDRIAELAPEKRRIESLEAALAGDPSLAGAAPGSPEYQVRLASLLEQRGEPVAARGHRLRALEMKAAATAPG